MGRETFSRDSYERARRDYGITRDIGVTHKAEQQARKTGRLSEIVDPAVDPVRQSKIRLNPYNVKWIATVGCPMDIEVSCDTTGSMGGEVDTEMKVLPDLYEAVAKVLPGYDPQLCLGIFGDLTDRFALCRPQFEMEAPKIVNYLKEMAPQRDGGDTPEDSHYAMFARAYLTDAYTNKIGLKGYHFIVTDATCHKSFSISGIKKVFGEDILENELKGQFGNVPPSLNGMVADLKKVTHQFVLLVGDVVYRDLSFWTELCGEKSVINISSTDQLPEVISAIIGLTESTLSIGDLEAHFGGNAKYGLLANLAQIEIGAQAKLRRALPHPVPKKGDIFENKGDLWPVQNVTEMTEDDDADAEKDEIVYL